MAGAVMRDTLTREQHQSALIALRCIEEIEAICLGNRTANTSAVIVQTRRGALAIHSLINSGTVYPVETKIPA
jgi:hypothetical protein